MQDALVVIDVFDDFDHEDGEALLDCFRACVLVMEQAIASARGAGVPVIYVNDLHGQWVADAPGLVRASLAKPASGSVLAPLAPEPGDRFLLKPRYSAFDHTPLVLLLRELETERVVLVGATTEGCVVQSGLDARELGFKVTILADACATTDPVLADLAVRYAEGVGGMRISEADRWIRPLTHGRGAAGDSRQHGAR
ncbi:MAG: isochorismatase family cysteine hydrolase [Gaiellaceae bacterium]